MVPPPLRARCVNGQNTFDVEEPSVRGGLGNDAARQVQLQAFGDLFGEIRKSGCGDGLCQLLAVTEKLQGLVIGLDVDEKPSAPLAVHAADVEHLGRDGTVCAVLSTAALAVCRTVAVEKPLDDPGLEREHLSRARGDLPGGLLVHRAGELDRQRVDPPVG